MMKSVYLFLLIPVVFLITSVLYIFYGGIYIYGVDPEFNYLFNGITLAHLKVHLNAVGHPGTPVQILIAITAWVVHLFRPGQSLWDDVMLHPEVYIRATVYTAAVINSFFLFLLGVKTFRYSKNLVASLALQLSPFVYLITLEVSMRLMPELIMVSIVSCWLILLVRMIYEAPGNRNYKNYSLLFGLLFAFSLAAKLTFLTFFILPLFLLPGIKLKLRYVLISILAFALFAFPAMLNFHKFTEWITGIFIHKGPYGTGDTGILDLKLFKGNLEIMLRSTFQLWIPLLILTGLALYMAVNDRKNTRMNLAFGLVSVIVFHYIITAKHYAFYYFVPSLLFTVFTGFLCCLVFAGLNPKWEKSKIPDAAILLFVVLLMVNVAPKVNHQLDSLKSRNRELSEAIVKFEPHLNNQQRKIICAAYYGCAPVEYSLLFGLLESGHYKKELNAEYLRHYPSSIVYLPWTDIFYRGVNEVNATEFMMADSAYILHIAEFSEEMLHKLLTRLQADTLVYKHQLIRLEESGATNEALYSFKLIRK